MRSQPRESARQPLRACGASGSTSRHGYLHPTDGAAPRTCRCWRATVERVRSQHEPDDNSQVRLGSADKSGKLTLVLALDVLDAEDSSGLLVHDRTQAGLALDNDVWHTHLAAQRRKEDHKLDRVDVVGDNDERRLLRLDEGNSVVEAVLDKQRLLGVLCNIPERPSNIS